MRRSKDPDGPASGYTRGTVLRAALGIAVAGAGLAGGSRLFEFAAAQAKSEEAESVIDVPARIDWAELRGRIRGTVSCPGDTGFGAAKQIFNTRFDAETPAAVVQVADANDVSAAMTFAAAHHLSVAARSGGHSYAGVSAATGVLIVDVRTLQGVSYADGRATVGPGHTLFEVYQALDRYGQSLPTGMCPDVGVAGLTLGGGIGFESRAHGLTCDRLRGATLVLPDGTVTEVSRSSRPELLWALRGGGPYAGIVTSMTFDTIPATAKDVVRLDFPGDCAKQVIAGWTTWLKTAPREQWADVSVDADGTGGLNCWMQLICPDHAGAAAAAALSAAIGVKPLAVDVQTLSHMDTVLALADGSPTMDRESFTNGSDIVAEVTPGTVDRILQALTTFSRAGGTGWVQINTLDGAVRDIATADTAWPWRNHAALVEWGAYQPITHDTALAWVKSAHELLGEASVGAYVNYLEPGDPLVRYYGPNHERLRQLRRSVDPGSRIYSVLTA